jgi:hypothetical protein
MTDFWLLTAEEYDGLVDAYCDKLKADLKDRFRAGSKKRGRNLNVDLSERDWKVERWSERVDGVAYELFEGERQRRAKEAL